MRKARQDRHLAAELRQRFQRARQRVVGADLVREPMPLLVRGMILRRKADAVGEEDAAEALRLLAACRRFLRLNRPQKRKVGQRRECRKADAETGRSKNYLYVVMD